MLPTSYLACDLVQVWDFLDVTVTAVDKTLYWLLGKRRWGDDKPYVVFPFCTTIKRSVFSFLVPPSIIVLPHPAAPKSRLTNPTPCPPILPGARLPTGLPA